MSSRALKNTVYSIHPTYDKAWAPEDSVGTQPLELLLKAAGSWVLQTPGNDENKRRQGPDGGLKTPYPDTQGLGRYDRLF